MIIVIVPSAVDLAISKEEDPEPQYQHLYVEACQEGTRAVHRTRIMLLGHFGAGKTSVKRSLLYEPFENKHLSTDAIDVADHQCLVDINNSINWQPGWV